MRLLMISGAGAAETARGGHNAFYSTLEELHRYFDRIDILTPVTATLFGNVFFHPEVPERFDVMTVHEYAPFRNGRAANRIWEKIHVPMIFEIMHIPGVPRSGSWRELVARLMTRWYIARDIRHAVAVRVINRQVGQWLQAAGVPAEKIKLVPAFYIDLDVFKPMNLEKKYDLVFVGRRAKNKGIELVESLKFKVPSLKILVVDGWAKDAHEVAKLMNQSRILVAPSYSEGGPRVVLEAMACGVPVLATRVGIVPEVLPEEWIIDWSVDDIVEKAKRLLKEKSVVSPHVVQRFEKKTAIKAYADFLQHPA